jgi:hypothetical protein
MYYARAFDAGFSIMFFAWSPRRQVYRTRSARPNLPPPPWGPRLTTVYWLSNSHGTRRVPLSLPNARVANCDYWMQDS